MRVLQSRGWYTTTLSELRNRADLVVILGANVVEHYANFLPRFVAPKQTLNPARRKNRRVIYMGADAASPASTKAYDVECLACDAERLAEVVGTLRALVAGRRPRATRVAKAPVKRLERIAAAIKAAEYPVFVWAPGHLPGGHADLVIHAVTRLIDDLNQTQRAAGLALGGDGGALSAVNACAWLTGYPLHVSFAGKTLEYDPVRFRTARLLGDDEIDALLWIDAFSQLPPATASEVKTVVVGSGDMQAAQQADVFIPIGTPGVDHRGCLVRTDSVVSICLDQLRKKSAPSARKVLRDILEQA
jgi:formylmethanofuran dehydrogenase subunit B